MLINMKRFSTVCIVMVIIFLITGQILAQKADFRPKMDSLFSKLEANNKFMGTVAIIDDGAITYSRGVGFADVGTGTQASTSTSYRIGSITKMFTSVMVYQLFEEEKLAPEARLSAYFPQLPNAENISINDMLLHRSGLWSVTDDSLYLEWCIDQKSREDLLGIMKTHEALFQPGEKSEYSNSNYILLGFIIEDITGKDYATNLKERITEKIGLKSTGVGGKINVSKNEARSYTRQMDSWKKENETDMSVPGGAGAIASTSEELVLFANALFNGQLIGEASLQDMIKTEGTYGKGIFPMPFYEMHGFGHTGGIDGFRSVLIYFPENELGVALISNGLNYVQNDILIGILSIYLERPFTLPDFTAVVIDNEVLKKYEGIYSKTDFPLKLSIKLEDNHLTGQATGQSSFMLEAVSATEFRYDAAGIVITFPAPGKLNLKQGGMEFLMERE
jgi:CubicO group peptidase (beta-lactamase class C family)